MYNSLLFLALFLTLLVFGYLSLLRLTVKQQFGAINYRQHFNISNGWWLVDNLALNLTFVLLPVLSVLLFWGWSMAFLWLFIQHFLLESLFNLQVTKQAGKENIQLSNALLNNRSQTTDVPKFHRQCLHILVVAFLIILSSACLYFLTYLVDRQSGLLLALIALYASFHAFNIQQTLVFRALLAIATLCFGVLLSDKIGLSFFGNWQPISQLQWLDFNNRTIMACLLLALALTQISNKQLQRQFARACGLILFLVLLGLLLILLLNPQTIDAPIHNLSSELTPPSFILFFLFLAIPAGSLVINALTADTNNHAVENAEITAEQQYFRQQSLSLFNLLLLVVIFVSLLTAAGIGAWQTHYQNWPELTQLIPHLQLTLDNLMETLSISGGASIVTSLFYFLVCVLGINTLMITTRQLSTVSSQTNNFSYALVILCTFYLLANNVLFDHWLVFGAVCWVLFIWLLLQHTIANLKQTNSLQNKVIATMSIALGLFGCLQKVGFTYQLWQETKLLLLAVMVTLLITSIILLLRPCRQIIKLIRIPSDSGKLFNSMSEE